LAEVRRQRGGRVPRGIERKDYAIAIKPRPEKIKDGKPLKPGKKKELPWSYHWKKELCTVSKKTEGTRMKTGQLTNDFDRGDGSCKVQVKII